MRMTHRGGTSKGDFSSFRPRKFTAWPPDKDMVWPFPTAKKGMKYRFESWTADVVILGHVGKNGKYFIEGEMPNPFKFPKKVRP